MNFGMKCSTAYCNVKEMVPGGQLSYQASDVMWSQHSRTEETARERNFHNVLKGARQRQVLERQK